MTEETNKTMADYYARRASEYERVYQKPERQADLGRLADLLGAVFAGDNVLEIACGTGYWTQFIARSAKSIVATDINVKVLDIARQKNYGLSRVTFLTSDAYLLANVELCFTAGFHGFWWSHIPIERIPEFLTVFHRHLSAGATVVMIDNAYVEGNSTPISRRDEHGNTYQIRQLPDGSRYEVLKNFPTPAELRGRIEAFADEVVVKQFEYYWLAQYRKRQLPEGRA